MTYSPDELMALFRERLSPMIDKLDELGVASCWIIQNKVNGDGSSVVCTSDGVSAEGAADMCDQLAESLRKRSVVRAEKRGQA